MLRQSFLSGTVVNGKYAPAGVRVNQGAKRQTRKSAVELIQETGREPGMSFRKRSRQPNFPPGQSFSMATHVQYVLTMTPFTKSK